MRIQLDRQLLDRQIVDVDGLLVGKVDDVEFAVDEEGLPYLAYLFSGRARSGRASAVGSVGCWWRWPTG